MQASLKTVVRDAVIVGVAASLVGIAVNAIRADGIPLVAKEDHPILGPCPAEKLGPSNPVEAGDPLIREEGTLLIDARDADAFSDWHVDAAVNVYYDILQESPEYRDTIRQLLKDHRTAKRVVVYGDDEAGMGVTSTGEQCDPAEAGVKDCKPGDSAGTGFLLAGALSGQGMRNVFYVLGGVETMKQAAGVEGGAP